MAIKCSIAKEGVANELLQYFGDRAFKYDKEIRVNCVENGEQVQIKIALTAAKVAVTAEADLLILLSDIDGLYTADPRKDKNATLISEVHEIDENILSLAGSAGSERGTGGMETKLRAARIATEAGCDMIIANGSSPELLYDICEGKPAGTKFYAKG